jgi:hypothetical protein
VNAGARHLVAERPGAVLHTWREIDQSVRGVDPNLFHRARIEQSQRRIEAQACSARKRPRMGFLGYGGGRCGNARLQDRLTAGNRDQCEERHQVQDVELRCACAHLPTPRGCCRLRTSPPTLRQSWMHTAVGPSRPLSTRGSNGGAIPMRSITSSRPRVQPPCRRAEASGISELSVSHESETSSLPYVSFS